MAKEVRESNACTLKNRKIVPVNLRKIPEKWNFLIVGKEGTMSSERRMKIIVMCLPSEYKGIDLG